MNVRGHSHGHPRGRSRGGFRGPTRGHTRGPTRGVKFRGSGALCLSEFVQFTIPTAMITYFDSLRLFFASRGYSLKIASKDS